MREASRGPLCLRLGGDVWTSLAQFSRLFALGRRAPESRDRFELSAVQFSGLPGNDQTLDPHRDLAPSKVIDSCPVASFDLLRSEAAAILATR